MKGQTYDKEKEKINLGRLKTHGHEFQVVVEPKLAMKYRKGSIDDVREVLKSEQVFHDAKKGESASENLLEEVFGTKDSLEIASQIIKEGEVQVTSEYRRKVQEQKRKKLVDLIHRYSVNPQNDTPHPRKRIENALEEANVKISIEESVEDQVNDVVEQLRPVLPIKFEIKQVQILLSGEHAAKLYGTVKQYGEIVEEDWLDDGSWKGIVEIPGGLENELYDKLNDATHGEVQTSVIKTK